MFQVMVHADWSVSPAKRWCAWASRRAGGWQVAAPRPVRDAPGFTAALLAARAVGPVLAGFDFPLGLPFAYGRQTGLTGFRDALAVFGSAPGWEDALQIASDPSEVSLRRPFFPREARAGVRRGMLVTGLGLETATDLLRVCERGGGPGFRQACPVFWTLGANQVGRAAIAGWREVVVPARAAGAALWPYDGPLEQLARAGALVLAETYPADAYARTGAAFGNRASKRRRSDRQARAAAIMAWAAGAGIDLAACRQVLFEGFGDAPTGEDAFDALLGVLDMIAVAERRRAALPDGLSADRLAWEGWILGRPHPGT
ncbi:DUF429 domain-containing protein [Lichenihabitans sp. Uapishka_5]|uniref:DUF429 domain-containing protein n=1 Tax=Lichenihabitans sp. Uapishka_5 TaxID=3037302 RepID=UPI0029E804EC|nr:DUF429 domain-containing protein [Lichenihabitans sp. Uapishka_5]MDX7951988.1 DUF429 domain-containing protein [Lichenihabitans sp. Uapishka_5]